MPCENTVLPRLRLWRAGSSLSTNPGQKRKAESEQPPRLRAIRSHSGGSNWLLTLSARQQLAVGPADKTKTSPGRIYAGRSRQVCIRRCQKRTAGFKRLPTARRIRSNPARQQLGAGLSPACRRWLRSPPWRRGAAWPPGRRRGREDSGGRRSRRRRSPRRSRSGP